MFQENMQLPMRMRKNRGKGEVVEVGGRQIVRSFAQKEKHSKICTSKGARDRRIRLSANTAIQFYDVQDRLGYDRPSNAIDWLMKKAKAAIDVLYADHYHHLHDFLLPDTRTSIFNLSDAFHPTPADWSQQNLNQDPINGFNKSPFEIPNSRNRCLSQEGNRIPVVQDIDFPFSRNPRHFAWNPNYNEREGFEFVNREPLQSSFHPAVVHTPNNEDDGLFGLSFEKETQV